MDVLVRVDVIVDSGFSINMEMGIWRFAVVDSGQSLAVYRPQSPNNRQSQTHRCLARVKLLT